MTPTIQQEITLLKNTKNELRTSIMEKGVVVQPSDLFSTYPTRISQITATAGDKDAELRGLIENSLTSFDIPVGTKNLRNYALSGQHLTHVTIPNTVTRIGKDNFNAAECGITVPSSVTYVDDFAFYSSEIPSVTFKATTPPEIGLNYIFSLTAYPIYVPAESVDAYKTAWPTYASRIQAINTFALKFTPKNGGAVTEVELEDLATPGTISWSDVPSTIRGVEGSLEIGEGVTTIDNGGIFQGLQITVVTIPDSVTTIGTSAFWNCTRLTSVTIPNSITYINESVFDGCSSLASIVIPDSVTSIGDGAFTRCTGLTSVSIGNNVTTIGGSAFFGDTSLTSVNIPDTVTTIGDWAFEDCSSLASVVIGTGIEEIGDNQFGLYRQSSSALTSVTVKATTPPTIGAAIFDDENTGEVVNPNLVIYVPAASLNAYKTATGWSDYASRIQAIPS